MAFIQNEKVQNDLLQTLSPGKLQSLDFYPPETWLEYKDDQMHQGWLAEGKLLSCGWKSMTAEGIWKLNFW